MGSALADPSPDGQFHNAITGMHVEQLEQAIDALEAELEPLMQFILPGGTPAAAQLHLARTVCRRAERLAVELSHKPGRVGRSQRARLPQSAQRPAVRAGPRGQPSKPVSPT